MASLSESIRPFLPFLRRYARALTGSQKAGDAYVRACLEALIADRSLFDESLPPRVGLYKLFYQLWSSTHSDRSQSSDASLFERTAQERLERMAPEYRQALLLKSLEQFSVAHVALIMDRSEIDVALLIERAISDITDSVRADVLIIEDEPLISMDLAEIVEDLGHTVSGQATTASQAVKAAGANRPDLVLADIQLADGSSGIDAVKDILAEIEVPVIFITSFPERLLTGERPEPTFLITKPYEPDMVRAAVAQALFFRSTKPLEMTL
jgi:CheY-like chemotaxis protein/DNA-directed RNA polymerase specialized sigma24 family protein